MPRRGRGDARITVGYNQLPIVSLKARDGATRNDPFE